MVDWKIRSFHACDIPHLLEVCLKTARNGEDGTGLFRDPWFIGQLYALPYLIRKPEICSVVTTDEVPGGYILGTDDSSSFYQWMESEFLPPLRLRYPAGMRCTSPTEEIFHSVLHGNFSSVPVPVEYPAHLHIDLLPLYQGQGLGRKLMDRFMGQLKERGCPGVHLQAGSANVNAVAFYRKLGFTVLEEGSGSVTMGKKL